MEVFDPVSLGIGLVGSAVQGLFGASQADAQNRAAERQAELQHEANVANWKFNKITARRQNKYDKQSVNIQRFNIENNLAYQEETANRNWRYQMQIGAFDYANQLRGYNKSRQTALQQLDYNNLAYDFALQDTARWEQEQSIMMDFEESTTMLEYRYAQRGEALNMAQAEATLQQSRGMGLIEKQRAYVEGLEQAGAVQARGGMGVSAEKVARASIAKVGAATAAIIQNVFNAEQNYSLSSEAVNLKLEQINDSFYLDKAQLAASRASLGNQAKVMRNQAIMSKKQADLNAVANIMLEPMKPVPIPAPIALPRPELQDPLEFDKKLWNSIRPKKGAIATQSALGTGLASFASGAFNAALASYTPSVPKPPTG
jgi:hypothetical protein